jgi:hypothetical protein
VIAVILETVISALLGLGLSLAAVRLLPRRLPAGRVVLPAGLLGAVFGAYVTHMALGPGHLVVTLCGAAAVSAVVLSLLLRPGDSRMGGAIAP